MVHLILLFILLTGSGDPRKPESLHFLGDGRNLNSYQRAIHGVGQILQEYDADKLFPTYGFGARFANGEVSHFFALNGQPAAVGSLLQSDTLING